MKASVSDQNNLIELQRIDSAIMQATHKLKTLPEREQLTAIHTRLAAIEARVMAYDLLKARLMGMATVAAAAIGAAWYWLHDKIETALGK